MAAPDARLSVARKAKFVPSPVSWHPTARRAHDQSAQALAAQATRGTASTCSMEEETIMQPTWTAADIVDLTGRRAVVTGANSGIGFHTALHLVAHGAQVVLACRDEGRGAEAARRIAEALPQAPVELQVLDLADLASIRRFAVAYGERQDGLDILVNNAGVMGGPRRPTTDGFEMHFGTNHLGHFALTGLLLPSLLARPGARVVTVSSQGAALARIDFANLQGERRYRWLAAYCQSKLANLLFAFELDRRARAANADLVSVVAHPGVATTNLLRDRHHLQDRFLALFLRLFAPSAAQGALPSLYAATVPAVRGSQYLGPGGFFGMRGLPTQVKPPRQALDLDTAQRLWAVSEELTGVRYDALAQAQLADAG